MTHRAHLALSTTACALTLICSGAATHADPGPLGGSRAHERARPVDEEAEILANFKRMVGELEVMVKKTKRAIFAAEAEIKKTEKAVQAATWRVDAARERYDDYLQRLKQETGADAEKLNAELGRAQGQLKQDAVKTGTILERAEALRAELTALHAQLKKLSDDVAIEINFNGPDAPGQGKAKKLVAESEWALAKIEELNGASNTQVEDPASHVHQKATVGRRGRAAAESDLAAKGAFQKSASLTLSELQAASAAGRYATVGRVVRGAQSCDIQCLVDDAAGVDRSTGALQLACTGSALLTLSFWKSGSPEFPSYTRMDEMPCSAAAGSVAGR